MEIKLIDEMEFSNFENNYQYKSIYQTTEYGNIMKKQNFNTFYIGAYKNNNIVAASLILVEKIKGFNYAYAPRGFLIDYTNKELLIEFTNSVKKFLNKMDIVAIKLSPSIIRYILNKNGDIIGKNPDFDSIYASLKENGYYHYGFNKGFEANKPRFEAILDISNDYKTIFKNIKKEFKTKIRSAEKQGTKIYHTGIEDINILYDQVKDKYNHDIEYYKDVYNFFNKNDKIDYYYAKIDTEKYLKSIQEKYQKQEKIVTKLNNHILSDKENTSKILSRKINADKQLAIYQSQLVFATNMLKEYPNGCEISSIFIIKHGNEIFLYVDGYNQKFKNLNAKHLLIWKIIEKYSKLGYKRFNLGGVTYPKYESKYQGLSKFKTNFGANIIEYIGDLELVTNSFKYTMYRGTKKVL